MSSKTKKKDKKKSKNQKDSIELTEISAEETDAAPTADSEASAEISPEPVGADEVGDYKVKVIPALGSQSNIKYEETTAALLNSAAGEGYKLLCVLPSADPKKLVAFFKSSNKSGR